MFRNLKHDGIALISALILIAIATSITTFIFKNQQSKIKEINLQRINLQATQIYDGAVDWIKLILDEDLKFSETDTLDEPWTLKLEKIDVKNFTEDISLQKEFSNAHINGYLIDAERMFNITNLILGDSKRKTFYKKVFENLLDQFSDFSGVDLTTNGNGSVTTDDFVSNAVVAPVREMVAQIIAILLEASPLDVWNCTHDLLMRLYTRKHQHQNRQGRGCQWEISHGVLLTWKYVIAITLFQSTRNQPRAITNIEEGSPILRPLSARQYNSAKDRYDDVVNGIILHAIKEISDGNDDNRAVAAQLLRYCTRLESQLRPNDIVYRCSGPLWTAVTKIGDISSCAADLLSLLTELLSLDSASFLSSLREAGASFAFDSLLYKLSEFIDHDSAHVTISSFRALSLIVEPITKSTSIGDNAQRCTDAIHSAIGSVLNQIFETYYYKPINGLSNENGRVRDQAWEKILDQNNFLFIL